MILGRLKRSLKERCPDCGHILQVRVQDIETIQNGIEISIPKEYICCSNKNCGFERYVEQKRRRRKQEEELDF